MSEFSAWVKQQIKLRGWSQRELGRRMSISQSYISDVLNDKSPPSVDLCLKLADVLEEPPENIFRIAGLLPVPQEESFLVVEILGLCRQLEREGQEQIRDYARFLLNKQRGIL